MTIQKLSTELLPDPSRLLEGLRDTGYEFNTAIADIVDNAIAASATVVEIRFEQDFMGELKIFIIDNGSGMDREGLLNAMKYGSPQRPDPSSLGKFGLGLKTASTAFCRSLSVVTRSSEEAPILKARWDLDHVRERGKWELLFLEPEEEEVQYLETLSENGTGTIVVWEKVDRLLKTYLQPNGTYARRALQKLKENLNFHLAMVYQRFLDTEDTRAFNVAISIDDEPVFAWDPFCRAEENSELLVQDTKEVEFEEVGQAQFIVRAYVIPRKEEFSTPAAAKNARVSNDMQGFYIYRENRLIHYADWLGMFRKEPHGSLLRVEFSFDHQLDDAFHVDIKKSRILLDEELFNWLKDQFLPAPRRVADEIYRKGNRKQVAHVTKGAHDSSNKGIAEKEEKVRIANVEVTDAATNQVEITNKKGKIRLKLSLVEAANENELTVKPVESLDDGLLWEPCLIKQHHAVRINKGHPYYHKVYVPNLASGVTVQGMDSLLWALSEAELGTINEATKDHFKELRFEVSRILRKLVEDLPEPELDIDEQ